LLLPGRNFWPGGAYFPVHSFPVHSFPVHRLSSAQS
jgi:hypothetical protein